MFFVFIQRYSFFFRNLKIVEKNILFYSLILAGDFIIQSDLVILISVVLVCICDSCGTCLAW